MEQSPSHLLEQAVEELSRLPGIGKKTAMRLALHLLKQEKTDVERLGNALIQMKREIKFCTICHNISDTEVCNICSGQKREQNIICVVEDIRDVIAIENTSQFNGLFHVLGGVISPMDGVGPRDLNIQSLTERIQQNKDAYEVILALSSTVEGDTTSFYIYKQLKELPIKITTIARGIAVGDELEYADEITLGRSLVQRTLFENTLKRD